MTFKRHNTEERAITPNTRVPIYVVGSVVVFAVYVTVLFAQINSKLDSALSVQQYQEWLDNAREKNPTINWPRLPDKRVVNSTEYTEVK